MLLEFGAEQNNLLVDSSLKLTSSPGISLFRVSQSFLSDITVQQLELKLQQFATNPELTDKIDQAFGNNWDIQKAQSLTQDWLTGEFKGLPEIKIVSQADINGANGAFADAIDTIYLSREFLAQNTANPEAVVDVLLEETGHFIDSVINSTDTPGDEGELFAALLQSKTLTPIQLAEIQAEDDTATVVIDGQTLVIEQDNTLSTAFDVGTLSGTRSFSGWVGSTDTNDYYRFYVGSSNNLSLNLNGLSADADVQLLNSSGGVITSSAYGGSTAESITQSLNPGTYYVRVYRFSGDTNYNLSLSVPTTTPTNVTITASDSSAAETLSGQTANPGRFTITRTGTTSNALTVNYTVAGTATKGTDYSNLTGSLTIPAGSTTATLPVNVIDDSTVEGSETSVVSLSSSSAYTLGSTSSATVTIADNDVAAINMGVNQTLSGSLSTTDPSNPTRTGGYYKDDYRLTGVTVGQPVKVNLNSSAFDAYVQIINQATGAVVTYNDDANGTNNSELTFTPQSGVNYLVRVTSYYSGITGAYSLSTTSTPPTTVSITASDSSAAETLSGQTANPGRFTITRTGTTSNALTVNYTVAGTATKGTDYSNLTGSLTIPAGSTTATLPVN
ncbi:Calx-beta domain-containing protein, partial [Planktothrix mougeotii]